MVQAYMNKKEWEVREAVVLKAKGGKKTDGVFYSSKLVPHME